MSYFQNLITGGFTPPPAFLTPNRLKHLAATMLLILLGICKMDAQCNVTAVVENGNVIFTVTNPTPGVTYTWTADFTTPNNAPFSGNGTSFTVPTQQPLPNIFNIRLVGSDNPNQPCWQVNSVAVTNACFETAGYTFQVNGCTVKFNPVGAGLPNVVSFNWNFGDGSPVSHETSPSHDYPAPGGTFQASLTTIFSFPSNWQIFVCTQPITTVCGTLCGTPPDLGYNAMEFFDCCKLKVSFDADCDDCAHTWQFGNCATSSAINPVFTVQNISTYSISEGGTPTIPIIHTMICPGQAAVTETTTYTFQNQGIFVGTAGNPFATVSMLNVVSCQNGAPLFPGLSLPAPTTRNIHCYSTLNVDKSYNLNTEHVCMDPCTGITVLAGKTLNLNLNNVIENGPHCSIWRGIQVNNTGKLTISGQSVIRDAMVGVQPMGVSSVLTLSGGRFINNFVGLAANNAFILTGLNNFNGNTFMGEGIGTMDPQCGTPPGFIDAAYNQVQPYAGVFLRNSSLTIPSSTIQMA
jgi:hypothetical protein